MTLRTPAGGIVSVSEQRAEALLKRGFKRIEESPAPKKRGRPKKAETLESGK